MNGRKRYVTGLIYLYRLGVIIEATGAATYHGFLPSLVRDCVAAVTSAGKTDYINDRVS